jgi:Cof subfamily protein (haloacid dehalogenase superfamily)
MDMDGTILDKNYRLSPAVKETLDLAKSEGKKIIIATGRVYSSAAKHSPGLGGVDGFVCSNGADIYDGGGRLIAETHMDRSLSRRLVEISRAWSCHFHAFVGDDWYFERETPYTEFYVRRSGLDGKRVNFDDHTALEFTKCMFLDDHERLEPIRIELERLFGSEVQIMYSAPFMLEVVVNGVNKASGLETCVKQLGGNLSETIAFGDAENDEDMLLAAGVGVAMGNAPEQLKAKLRYTAPSVDDDGVAVFLKEFFGL